MPSLPTPVTTREIRPSADSGSNWRGRVRSLLPADGVMLRYVRAARFALILGPWRGLTVAVSRRLFRKRAFSSISPTLFPNLDADTASQALDRDGFAVGLQLPRASIRKICEFASTVKYMEGAHRQCPEINRVVHDVAIVDVVKRYLGVNPILYDAILFWTFPHNAPEAPYPEKFHYDVGDVKSVSACFYLTDAALDSGAHVAIAGTHKNKSIRRLINPFLSDEYAARRFGSRVTTFIGPAGTGFFEDQAAYHKRLPCTKPRLALFVNYTLWRKPDMLAGDKRK